MRLLACVTGLMHRQASVDFGRLLTPCCRSRSVLTAEKLVLCKQLALFVFVELCSLTGMTRWLTALRGLRNDTTALVSSHLPPASFLSSGKPPICNQVRLSGKFSPLFFGICALFGESIQTISEIITVAGAFGQSLRAITKILLARSILPQTLPAAHQVVSEKAYADERAEKGQHFSSVSARQKRLRNDEPLEARMTG